MWRLSGRWTWPSACTSRSQILKSVCRWFLRRGTNPYNPLQTHILIHNAHIARSNQLRKNKSKSHPTFSPVSHTNTSLYGSEMRMSLSFSALPLSGSQSPVCQLAMWYHWFPYMSPVTMVTVDSPLSFSFQWCLETMDAARRANTQSKYKEGWRDSRRKKKGGLTMRERGMAKGKEQMTVWICT